MISREIVHQRHWRRLATEYAGVDELPDYLRSDTKDVKKLSLTAVIICLAMVIICLATVKGERQQEVVGAG